MRNLDTNVFRTTTTDGGGFYGGVDLTPGRYRVKAELGSEILFSQVINVTAGAVTTADILLSPTAASVSVSGRVLANRRGIANVQVSLTNSNGETRAVLTNAFGYYSFSGVIAGEVYIISPTNRRIQFSPSSQSVSVNEDLAGIDFIGQSRNGQR